MKKNLTENGQIIVILAVAITALLGFAALAIDVGMVYSDRRYDQSVADSAALAGAQNVQAGFDVNRISDSGGTMCANAQLPGIIATAKNIAIASMNRNDFLYSTELSNGHGTVDISCVTVNGSVHVVQVTTQIMSQTNTSFAHLFFGGKMINTVKAVAWVSGSQNVGYGNSIAAFKPTCESSSTGEIWFAGGGHTNKDTGAQLTDHIQLLNGGIYSNACMSANGHQVVEVLTSLSPLTYSPSGAISYRLGTFTQPSAGSVTPNPLFLNGAPPLPVPKIPIPNCGPIPAHLTDIKVNGNNVVDKTPGWYSGIAMTGGTLNLASGSYCFEGDVKVTGGILTGPSTYSTDPIFPTLTEHGVTIYMHQGEISISGNAEVKLRSPSAQWTSLNPPAPKAIPGYLIITDKGNACNDQILDDQAGPTRTCIGIAGGSAQAYTGTIIAPYGAIDFGGSSNINCTTSTQILGWTVKVHGETDMCIKYEDSLFGQTPPSLSMAQ